MTTTKSPAYRSHTTPPTERIQYRQPDDSEDGVFEVRMPIATTGEVRNEGDDPLTRDELSGMATQIEDRTVGVFLDHGGTNLGGMERYSAIEKVGEWREPSVETREDGEGPAELVATARMMDPESLPAGVKDLRAALGSIKEQVKRDFSVSASIGWREDDSYPGGNDLMEASIVGIGADPRTTSESDTAAMVARSAVAGGLTPEELVDGFRAVMAIERDGEPEDEPEALSQLRETVSSERPLGPPEDPDRFDTFEECVQALTEEGELSEEEAERVCGAWENAKDQTSNSVTDTDDTGADAGTTEQEQSESEDDGEEFREFMREQQEQQTELLQTLAEAIRQEDDDEDDDEDDEEENEADEDEEDDEDEQSASPDSEQDADGDLKERIAELEATLEDVRSGEQDVESPGDADTDEAQSTDDDESSNAVTATPEEWGRHTN